jgi:hypothetical protein
VAGSQVVDSADQMRFEFLDTAGAVVRRLLEP